VGVPLAVYEGGYILPPKNCDGKEVETESAKTTSILIERQKKMKKNSIFSILEPAFLHQTGK
jgi:hypothetical protein